MPSLKQEALKFQESSSEVQSAQPLYSASTTSYNAKTFTTVDGFGKNSRFEPQVVRKREGFSVFGSRHDSV